MQQKSTIKTLDRISKCENEDKPTVTDNDNIEYFIPGPNSNIDKKASTEITQQL